MDPLTHEKAFRGQPALDRLAAARIVLCGAGAVGSNLCDTLARQGAKNLRVIDRDRVEPHNVATQVWYAEHAGQWKVEALRDHVFRATGVEIDAVRQELTPKNAAKLLTDADLVVDGFDNTAARRAVTDACAAASLPCLHVGLNAGYAEIRWNERYRVPSDAAGDVCDYPLARNLVLLATASASETILKWLCESVREDRSITVRDLRIDEESHT
ncbi:MAG: ThiF family adenylyltransferase [Planctomycetia bacterium]|nr:ThiF family adenylyltransferase [Planctomycetia bacterium]